MSPCSSMLCCVSRRGIAGADLGYPYDHCSSKERPVGLEKVVESGQFRESGEIRAWKTGKIHTFRFLAIVFFRLARISHPFLPWLTIPGVNIQFFHISFLVEKVRYFYQQDFQERFLRSSRRFDDYRNFNTGNIVKNNAQMNRILKLS